MENEFVATITGLVQAQNRTLMKLRSSAGIVATWFYALAALGVVCGHRDWQSFIVSTLFVPCRLAAVGSMEWDLIHRVLIVVDALLCVFIINAESASLLWHGGLSCALVYKVSGLTTGDNYASEQVGLALAMTFICPVAMWVKKKINGLVMNMEEGLARLAFTGDSVTGLKED